MRIYTSAKDMVREVERDLFEMGVRYQSTTVQDRDVSQDPGFRAIELNGYGYTLTRFDPNDMDAMLAYLGGNRSWAIAECEERLRGEGRNPGYAWAVDAAKWSPFLRDGRFAYSYGERWQQQLPYVIEELAMRPSTRQAVMTMYDVHQDLMNWGGRDRVPCSLTYHFLLRDNKLSLIYNQRSCDFMSFFATDVYLTCALLQHVALELANRRDEPIEADRFVHFLGSLHAFAKDLEGRNIF